MTIPPIPLRPNRRITGMSAVLLPHRDETAVDWDAFEAHVVRTHQAGLTPAVNMDTGYVQLIDAETRRRVLELTAAITDGEFVAGAGVGDEPGDAFDLDGYRSAAAEITSVGGTPIIFPSHGLNDHGDAAWLDGYGRLAEELPRFLGFELGSMFVPYGRIVDLDTYRGLLGLPQCVGAKHSSLSRQLEWERLALRDEVRPDFMVLTGNDLAIDMVTYGSDYLLGLSTFAPDAFARRDRCWMEGDPAFHELNDLLQYLGHFAFRPPVPAYRHDAAMFLQLRGWASSDATPAGASRRPEADRAVLKDIAERLEALL
ncbi:MAG: dihydrodipicolinate synthase family protein [Acidimicrobiales bacterium]